MSLCAPHTHAHTHAASRRKNQNQKPSNGQRTGFHIRVYHIWGVVLPVLKNPLQHLKILIFCLNFKWNCFARTLTHTHAHKQFSNRCEKWKWKTIIIMYVGTGIALSISLWGCKIGGWEWTSVCHRKYIKFKQNSLCFFWPLLYLSLTHTDTSTGAKCKSFAQNYFVFGQGWISGSQNQGSKGWERPFLPRCILNSSGRM